MPSSSGATSSSPGSAPRVSILWIRSPIPLRQKSTRSSSQRRDVTHVAENMAELQVRRLPVMNRDKRLVGIVSLADLAIEGSLPKTAKALHGISQPGGQHNQSRAELEG